MKICEKAARLAEDEAEEAVECFEHGDFEGAIAHADKAASLESDYGDAPTWGQLGGVIRSAIDETWKVWRCYEAHCNSGDGIESVGGGSVKISAETAEAAAKMFAATHLVAEEIDRHTVAVATDDDRESFYFYPGLEGGMK